MQRPAQRRRHNGLALILALGLAMLLATARAAEPADSSRSSQHIIDLHTHSTLSDGSDTPMQLVQRAASAGVTTLAFTEHDQLTYSPAALDWAKAHGIEIIQGTELSCEWSFALATHTIEVPSRTKGEAAVSKPHRASKVHLLGYFTRSDPDSPLARLLADLQTKRTSRNQIILDELKRKFNIAITAEQVVRAAREAKRKDKAASSKLKQAAGSSKPAAKDDEDDEEDAAVGIEYLGRPHIAMALIAAGHAHSISDAFLRFLSDEALPLPAWSLELGEAIQAIANHGGVAVMAHPITIGLGMQELEEELRLLLATPQGRNLGGLEVFSSKHTAAQSAALLQIAHRLQLIPTGGSDFHGTNKEGVPLARFGKGVEDGQRNTRDWATISEQSLQGMKDLKTAIEAAAVRRARGHRREGEGTGSLAEVSAILEQLCLYALLILTLLGGARLFEAPLPPQFAASGGGMRIGLVRAVKRNAVCAWLYGSAGSSPAPPHAHARNEHDAEVEVRTTTIAIRGQSSPSDSSSESLGAPAAASPLLDLESPPVTPLPLALRGLQGPVIRSASGASASASASASAATGLNHSMVSPAVATIGVGALHSSPGPRAAATAVSSTAAHHSSQPNRSPSQFLFCFLGLQLSYLSWGYLQERIMTLEYAHESSPEGAAHGAETESNRFSHSEFLVLLNRVFGGVIAFVVLVVQRIRSSATAEPGIGLRAHCAAVLGQLRSIPPYRYSLCSLSNILSSWFQYEALKYISFPLQVLSKSSKIAFTMLASTVIEGARFPLRDYASAAAIAGGMVAFRLGEHLAAAGGGELPEEAVVSDAATATSAAAVNPSLLSLLGFLLLGGYIVADSFTSTWQSRIFRESARASSAAAITAAASGTSAAVVAPISSVDMMLGTNLFSSLFSLCIMLVFGKLLPALRFGWTHPLSLVHAAWMSLFSSIGQLFIFHTISTFGAVAFASMMTARQLLSLGLSILAFGHHVHTVGWIGLSMVGVAMGAKIVQDVRKQQRQQQQTKQAGAGASAAAGGGKERKLDEAASATTLEMQRLNPTAQD